MLNKEDEPYSELLQNIPPILKAIIKALGLAKAQEFLIKFGGTQLTIPKGHTEKFGLSCDELNALREELKTHLINNTIISLPKPDKILISFRNHEIRYFRAKLSLNELAIKYHLTSRHIGNITRGQDKNYDLFKD